jgi:hypothetical protein
MRLTLAGFLLLASLPLAHLPMHSFARPIRDEHAGDPDGSGAGLFQSMQGKDWVNEIVHRSAGETQLHNITPH